MVPSREIIDDTAVVNDGTAAVNQRTTSYCEPVVESTVRSIRSVNTKDVSDGKATPTEDIKVTGKAGDLALGTEAGNETETNGTEASTETKLKGDSINSMTNANITSIAVAEERRRRDKQLAERKALVAKRTEAKTELERREKARREALAAAQRDSGADGDRAGVSEADIAEEQEKIRAYEAAFREIKEATGVSDVSEVIEKFLTQETTHRNLEQMTAEAQADIDKLTAKKREAHERMQRLKYSAEAGEEPPQVASPEPAGRTHERHRHRHERLAKVLVAIKAGVEHLADRLDGVDIEEARLALTEDNMVEVLHQCEKKLRRVIDAIREEEEAMVREMGQSTLKARPDMPSEPMAANNCRIGDVDGEDVDSEEEYEEDLEEEVFDRDALKEQSRGMLDMASKKRTKKRRANGN
ncbi:hypothetical protein EMIHUDRAFT_109456 [Emiliania huxleyi CCMP1516]|uniref:ODAD1 central coiled coil region domain-containing protein n=2 Tax=Emiliania huxleyi TaxID=2903 RepID=A0A0D3KRH3_EMIH1|nr:hypothetical protein EMIHUDRAFT_109456 [Emiliania huxleyi CCMP1516]EOD38358.1 hypothetical protein EMIHUDRAFT_109456 [Emiliania huxleyi CCMP1516]|eukprot:XP_005790787.1 hypothetical protein EMIHUDRAFT_109456 [Emiliania huxleyi CCMP1516]